MLGQKEFLDVDPCALPSDALYKSSIDPAPRKFSSLSETQNPRMVKIVINKFFGNN